MDTQTVLKYVMNSPENTNPNVLKGMLDQLSGGGGGGGDFTTATVTLVDNRADSDYVDGLIMAYLIRNEFGGVMRVAKGFYEGEHEVPLYNGAQIGRITVDTGTINVTGNATESRGQLNITGDCTITIS